MKNDKTLILCSCDNSITYAPEAFKSQGFDNVVCTDQLCGSDLDVAVAALTERDQVVFACEQQAQVFEQLAEELQSEQALKASLDLIDLRDRAGWTGENEKTAWVQAKQLALLADAALDRPGTKIREISSAGTCLIIGKDESVLPFAETLGQELAVTCVIQVPPKRVNPSSRYDLAVGQIHSVSGGLGAFDVTFKHFSTLVATGRGATQFTTPTDQANSTCDIVIDLASDTSILAAEATRDGYLRAPNADPLKLSLIGAQAKALVGTFEKPLYVKYEDRLRTLKIAKNWLYQMCRHVRCKSDSAKRRRYLRRSRYVWRLRRLCLHVSHWSNRV